MPTKYPVVWSHNAILANWLDQLADDTTLHTISAELEKVAEQWSLCSLTPESRESDSGASSCAKCIVQMNRESPLFKQFYDFILRQYGATELFPPEFDRNILKLSQDVEQLVALFGPSVQILQVQQLKEWPV